MGRWRDQYEAGVELSGIDEEPLEHWKQRLLQLRLRLDSKFSFGALGVGGWSGAEMRDRPVTGGDE